MTKKATIYIRIVGYVVDRDGNNVAGATVTLTNLNTNKVEDTDTSNSDGQFTVTETEGQQYTITAKKSGYSFLGANVASSQPTLASPNE